MLAIGTAKITVWPWRRLHWGGAYIINCTVYSLVPRLYRVQAEWDPFTRDQRQTLNWTGVTGKTVARKNRRGDEIS